MLVALLVMAASIGLLIALPSSILQDTWLALVDGRLVAAAGPPHHATLVALAAGRPWVDQQWLAQLWMYWLDRAGGLALVGTVDVLLIAAALGGAMLASLRLGAAPERLLALAPPAVFVVLVTHEVRTQPYAYPLFVLVFYLLAADGRRCTRNVYWCLPALVLWGNLHGSASMGAGLVALRGLVLAWDRRRRLTREADAWRRPLILVAGAAASLVASPYGTATLGYYRTTILNPAFRGYIVEWQPITTSVVLSVACGLLVLAGAWALHRGRRAATLWEWLSLAILLAGAILALRNAVWFALAAIVVLPRCLGHRRSGRRLLARRELNRALVALVALVGVGAAVRAFSLPVGRLAPSYPTAAAAAVRAAAGQTPRARVFADESYADWLLWREPALAGRVAYDASFELLSARQLLAIAAFKEGLEWPGIARGYRVLVLARDDSARAIALARRRGARVLYADGALVVLALSSA